MHHNISIKTKQHHLPSHLLLSVTELLLKETVCQSVAERLQQTSSNAPVVLWPQQSVIPVNEFTMEGYIAMAFPTLLPTGTVIIL